MAMIPAAKDGAALAGVVVARAAGEVEALQALLLAPVAPAPAG